MCKSRKKNSPQYLTTFFYSLSIARAGRADFIQPSLGSLQPNFEDFMDFDIDILNSWTNNRLAPVPEEQTEEILRAIEFPIMSKCNLS